VIQLIGGHRRCWGDWSQQVNWKPLKTSTKKKLVACASITRNPSPRSSGGTVKSLILANLGRKSHEGGLGEKIDSKISLGRRLRQKQTRGPDSKSKGRGGRSRLSKRRQGKKGDAEEESIRNKELATRWAESKEKVQRRYKVEGYLQRKINAQKNSSS